MVQITFRKNLALPAYDQCLKLAIFNLLDARGVISVTERTTYINRIRDLAKAQEPCGSNHSYKLWLNFVRTLFRRDSC